MISITMASVLVGLNATAVLTAIPSIIHDLGTTGSKTAMGSNSNSNSTGSTTQAYVWISNAYLLTTTSFTPIMGQSANLLGRSFTTLSSILIFIAGSAICAPSPSLPVLILGHAVQGIGSTGINTMVETVVCGLVPLRQRGKYIEFIIGMYVLSTTVGPLIGGAVTSYASWRWIFYLNLPFGGVIFDVAAVSLRALCMPAGSGLSWQSIRRIDFAGNALLITSITSMLIGLTILGGDQSQSSSYRVVVSIVLGVLGIPFYLLFETRIQNPTAPLRLFSNRTSFAGYWCAFIQNTLIFWIIFVLPIYFQAVLRKSAFSSGVSILPTVALFIPFTLANGRLLSRFGKHRPLLIAGFALYPVAMGLLTRLDEKTTTGYWIGIQLIGAVAIGIITPITLQAILTPPPESDVAVADSDMGIHAWFRHNPRRRDPTRGLQLQDHIASQHPAPR
ncbi:major facilitator superfamily domain-containing protein [Xylariaceae sp. FL0255]|nr:major facilitator superfamily domain-containing protein [Xylariaceae sp. FL0255]